MKLPRKLNPDLIKDSIVEVKYVSKLPYEIVIGKIHEVLTNKGFNYIPPKTTKNVDSNLISINLDNQSTIFDNDEITIKPTAGSLIFNCKEKYLGWDSYFPKIEELISVINGLNFVENYYRIGLRYINSFNNTNIFDKLIDTVRIKVGDFETKSTAFITHIIHKKFNVNLRVENDIILKDSQDKVSLLDIDVYYLNQKEGIPYDNNLFKFIEEAHNIEKTIFITLLKPEFLKTLKPEY